MDIFRDMKDPNIILIPSILSFISELDEFKGRFRATHLLSPERLSSLKKTARIESIASSTRIEGSKLSDQEVELLLRGVKTFSFRSRDEQEVAGYAELMEIIFQNSAELPVTENFIKQFHHILLKYSEKDERHRGEYKKFPNSVEAFDASGKSQGIIFQTISPFQTPQKIKALVSWLQQSQQEKTLHPLLRIAFFIAFFLYIHPFQDGNGRLSRILTTLLLLQEGYCYVPYSSLERIIEDNKEGYYIALRKAQKTLEESQDGLNEWFEFFLKCLQKQKRVLEAKLDQELLLLNLPPLSIQIIEIVKSRGPTALADLVKITNANRNTIKLHLKNLSQKNILVAEGKLKGTRYRIR